MSIRNGIICTVLVIIFLCYAPNLPPHAEFIVSEVIQGAPLKGPLSPNQFLENAERLHENVLIAPESIAFRNSQEIYVGIHGGDIVKVYGRNFEKIKVVANNGPGCDGFWEEAKCGRPLGIRFHKNGLLYVTDAYLGVFAVDVDKGSSKRIFDLSTPINGVLPRLPDDLDFDKEGNIYWSDASTIASLDSAALELFAGPTGRLIKYDIKTKKHKVLLDNLHFANGVQLSPAKDFVLVNDLLRKRTLRYWLTGPKAGTNDTFVKSLPGMPDNIRPRPEGGYYIAIISTDDDFSLKIATFFSSRPTLKKFMSRITAIMSSVAQLIDYIYPNLYCKTFVYDAFNLHTIARWTENEIAMVVEVDKNGKIVGSMQGANGQITRITEAQRVGDNIFFGSAFNKYLGRINVKDPSIPNQGVKVTPEQIHEKYEL